MNSDARNSHVQVFVLPPVQTKYFGNISRNGIGVSCGNSVFILLRNHQTVSVVAVLFYITASDVQRF